MQPDSQHDSPRQRQAPPPGRGAKVLVFAFFLTLCLAVQWRNGVYDKDFSSHPDEGAHVVTGLMVRDYLATGLPRMQSPVAFARGYYERVPKVALGHYPPVFYALEGVWLLPSRSPAAAYSLMAVLAALWGTTAFLMGRKILRNTAAALAAATVLLLLPEVQASYCMVMSDLLLAIFCLWAILAWTRWMEAPSAKSALMFGFLAAAACLTKASGLLLSLTPPLAILLTRRWRLLREKSLWLAALPVVLTAGPWTLATYKITQEGMLETPLSKHLPLAALSYSWALYNALGAALLALLGVGAIRAVLRRDALSVSLLALVLGAYLFYCLIPAGLEPRYMLPALPGLLLAAEAALFLASLVLRKDCSTPVVGVAAGVAVAALAALTGFHQYRWRAKPGKGYSDAAERLTQNLPLGTDSAVLVSSDPPGEGALIAALTFRLPPGTQGGVKILRGSKSLSTSDWMGRGMKDSFATADDMQGFLLKSGVDCVADDAAVPKREVVHYHTLLRDTLHGRPEAFPLLGEFPVHRPDGAAGALRIHHVQPPTAAAQ